MATHSPASHFGRQVKKERTLRGWSIAELGKRTGIDPGHLSRIESGKRPPTEKIALACDAVFPERRGYFHEYYGELRSWAPPGFRDWPEIENAAARVSEWSQGIVPGMLQTEAYARTLLAVHPGATADVVAARLANRMERQRRVLYRDDPPTAGYVIDHAALYREVGSPEIMADQLAHVAGVATFPYVTVQILPAMAHPATQGGFIVTDAAAYAETVVGGYVYTSPETVTALERLFATLRSESYRASESAATITKARQAWESAQAGGSPATAAATAGTA